jgi:hypothetical protein
MQYIVQTYIRSIHNHTRMLHVHVRSTENLDIRMYTEIRPKGECPRRKLDPMTDSDSAAAVAAAVASQHLQPSAEQVL